MKKIFFVSAIILLFGCSKEINSGAANNSSTYSIENASVATSTYLPLTKGTFWKYNIKTEDENIETSKLTVLGIEKKINSKNYQKVKSVMDDETDTLYYAQDNQDYYLYTNTGTSDDEKISLEILFLKDNASVGTTWNTAAGTADGFKLKCFGKIIAKNITLTVGGTTYTNVIHTYIEIRKPFLFTYIVVNKQDFYTAKNIGIIKNVSNILLPSSSKTTTNITDYKIY